MGTRNTRPHSSDVGGPVAAALLAGGLAVTGVVGVGHGSELVAIAGAVAAAGLLLGGTRWYLASGERRHRRATTAWVRVGIVVATLAVVIAGAHAVGLQATVAGARVEAIAWGTVGVLVGGYGVAELRVGSRYGSAIGRPRTEPER